MAKVLNAEETEALQVIIEHGDGCKAMLKLLEACVTNREIELVKYTLNSSNFNELAITKARAEGARQMVTDLKRELETYKQRPPK